VKRLVGSTVIVAAAAALTGCGASTPAADCIALSADVMQTIADGADAGREIVGQEAQAVKGTGEDVYFVAMRFQTKGGSDEVGVWGTNAVSSNAVTTVIAIDGFAKQFTHWPDAQQAFGISPAHPKALAAEGCLK
jgi:hypothetical protein